MIHVFNFIFRALLFIVIGIPMTLLGILLALMLWDERILDIPTAAIDHIIGKYED